MILTVVVVSTVLPDPLNEEAGIRVEMGRLKDQKETVWDEPTNRTVYRWSEASKTTEGVHTTKTSLWTRPAHLGTRSDRRETK